MKWILLFVFVWSNSFAQAQINDDETTEEMLQADKAVEGAADLGLPADVLEKAPNEPPADNASGDLDLDEELNSMTADEAPASQEPVAVDQGPEQDSSEQGVFRKPPGPVQGGILKVPHPGAAQGLLRINKDGSYQYKTKIRPKSQAMSVRAGLMTPPNISDGAASYKSMYGSDGLFMLSADYEWQPLRGFGALGLQFGTGFAMKSGSGTLSLDQKPSEEKFDFVVIPMSAFAIYRFEFVRRQWVVPFVNGGLTYYGLAERRDDDAEINFAGAAALGGGGGVHLSISRLDALSAFTLDQQYGISDMWLTVEGRMMQSLSQDIDFTNQMISLGITVDY